MCAIKDLTAEAADADMHNIILRNRVYVGSNVPLVSASVKQNKPELITGLV